MKTKSMVLNQLQLFKILKEKLGESQAESLVTFVDNRVNEEFEDRKETFATKDDISTLRQDMYQMEGRLSVLIAKTRTDQMIWTIAMFAGLFIASIAFLKFIK